MNAITILGECGQVMLRAASVETMAKTPQGSKDRCNLTYIYTKPAYVFETYLDNVTITVPRGVE